MRRCFQGAAIPSTSCMILLLLCWSGCTSRSTRDVSSENEGAPRLMFVNRPDLKLGFTTQNFIECLPVDVDHAKELVEYAAQQGYHWIELRDPDAKLTFPECEEIAALAKKEGIEIAYANQRGLIDGDFWEVFDRGVVNAATFEGPRTIRAGLSGELFVADPQKQGFSKDELDRLVAAAERAAEIAKKHGLRLVVENGMEVLCDDGKDLYGFREFLAAVKEDVYWQPDTGNFFCGARIPTPPEVAKKYLDDHISRVCYIHLKSSQDNEPQAVLTDNALDFAHVFDVLASHRLPYVAVELDVIENAAQAYKNLEASVDYLKKSGHIVLVKKRSSD